jgi:uncharacterized protein YodC (DUF2158 family)
MTQKIKCGDVVSPKTGGYIMTAGKTVKENSIECVWFTEYGALRRGQFNVDCLTAWVKKEK